MIKKTASEWWHEHELRATMRIYDPDGFDRENFRYSFYDELITEDEFNKKLMICTLVPKLVKDE